ncbi:MAG TPA: cell division protein ZapB [Thermoanaerobaculia bacterium]|nr:cell division protein ZapB [Thermoanaerobaculia bacterium]HEV7573656.1 cell division protein ZapB [Thermoanaerobaculia bacterium]
MKKTRENDQLTLAGTEEEEILGRLNDRVEKAIAMIQELRKERDTLRRQLDDATARLQEQGDATERASTLEEDNERFKRERGEIRDRIESILTNLEALEEA